MISDTRIDLHMHTTVSDGSDTPGQIISRVKETGIGVFSVTDHDTVKACRMIRDSLKEGDPAFICGAEFSCEDELGKYHILAYYDDPDAPTINELVEKGHSLRMEKVSLRLDFLKSEFGFTFSDEDINGLLSLDNPGKPHIGNLMIKYGYANNLSSAIYNYLNKLELPRRHVRPEYAIECILGGNGIPVLAHPFFGDGDQLIVGGEMDERLKRLAGFGIRGVEAFYSGFTSKMTENMLNLAEKYDFYVTAGSDYPGPNKLVQLGDTGLADYGCIPPRLEKFLKAFGI